MFAVFAWVAIFAVFRHIVITRRGRLAAPDPVGTLAAFRTFQDYIGNADKRNACPDPLFSAESSRLPALFHCGPAITDQALHLVVLDEILDIDLFHLATFELAIIRSAILSEKLRYPSLMPER